MVDLGPVGPFGVPPDLTDDDLDWVNRQRAIAGLPETWRDVPLELDPRISEWELR